MDKKWHRLAIAAIGAVSILAACQGAGIPTEAVDTPMVVAQTPQVVVVTPVPTIAEAIQFHAQDPTNFIEVQANEPETLDPVVTTDKSASAILQNVYETLVFFKRDSVTEFIPQLAEEVPTIQNGGISPDGLTYTFKIRQGIKFHNGDPLTPSDVAFSLQRLILAGGSNSPAWLLFEPVLGSTTNNDITDLIDASGSFLDNPDKLAVVNPGGLQAMCQRVQHLISANDQAGTVTLKLVKPWGPLLMILAGPYSSIMDRNWVAQNGGWNGSCASWQNFYDRTADQQNQTKIGQGENGTGPFILDHWTAGRELVLKANPDYWRKDPAWDGGPSGAPALKKVTLQFIKGSGAHISALKSGSADAIGQYSSSNDTKLDEIAGETCNIQGKCTSTQIPGSSIRSYTDLPSTTRMDALFNYDINALNGNPLLGSGQLDGAGIPPNFFTDVFIRQAFSYCFDWDAYITQALGGHGRQLTQVMMPGELGADPQNPHYRYDPQACANAFKSTVWKAVNGGSLWDTGFHLSIVYNPRLPASQVFADVLSQGVSAVNNKFVIQVTNQPWEIYTDNYRNKRLPILFATSREVIADPHNWADLMTVGRLGYGLQRMPLGMRYQFQYLVDKGVQTTDPAARAQIYQKFNQLYYQNASAILLAQALDKRYEQRWVSGYYFNPMYADLYYYVLSKQ